MTTPNAEQLDKAYREGEMRAMEEDAGISSPSPFGNLYDERDEPELAYQFTIGYNNATHNIRERRKAEQAKGSWFPVDYES